MFNMHSAPPLIDTNTGALSAMWVQWYSCTTQSSLEDSIKAGVTQMLELQQRMIGFIRENTINPKGVLATFGHNYNMTRPQGANFGGMGFSAFDNSPFTTKSTGPYAELDATEPSLFYKLNEGTPPNEFGHPWNQWKMLHARGQTVDLNEVEAERLDRIKQFEAIPRSTTTWHRHPLSLGPMMTTPAGNVSLLWVLWQGSKDTNSSYQEIHNKVVEYLNLNNAFTQPNDK